MPIAFEDQEQKAIDFSQYCQKRLAESDCTELSFTQFFWDRLTKVVNITTTDILIEYIKFEQKVSLREDGKHTGRIDAYIPDTQVLIEQKNKSVNLDEPRRQSDKTFLTPYQQALRYKDHLPADKPVRFIVVSNFYELRLYNLAEKHRHPESITPTIIRLEDLEHQFLRLTFLVDPAMAEQVTPFLPPPTALSFQAGRRIARIYDKLYPLYVNAGISQEAARTNLNKLCVRLVFCWFASDAGLFDQEGTNLFKSYLYGIPTKCGRWALRQLFQGLDTSAKERDPLELSELQALPYVDGGLFDHAAQDLIPQLNDCAWRLTINENKFDWAAINPTIYGALYESTVNPALRRVAGMHYTSVENIHKVIDPLFLNELKAQFAQYMAIKSPKIRTDKLKELQDKLARLQFLDPACGSGNFLTETYLSLRRLENEIIRELHANQAFLGVDDLSPVKVNISQFKGIEINGFAVAVAKTALWIAHIQMLKETSDIINHPIKAFPLDTYENIVEGNALALSWEQVAPLSELSYIIGNPPFSGAQMMSHENKLALQQAFGSTWPTKIGDLDFVSGWFKKAHDIMLQAPHIKTAFVATNSICQGSAITNLWAPLQQQGTEIIFAYRSFLWDSAALDPASVYCVIVGLANKSGLKQATKHIYDGESVRTAKHINAYLLDADDAFIYARRRPLCPVPIGGVGNQPIDGGNFLFTSKEKAAFLKKEPQSAPYFKRWFGSQELLHGKERYCLYLGDCSDKELANMPRARKRIADVRMFRKKSKSAKTRKLAQKSTHFATTNIPQSNFLVLPKISSYRRAYIPIVFMKPADGLCSDLLKLFPNATLFHFAVLMSSVHMVWVKTVCGRLKMDYRYSTELVYNTFPWPQQITSELQHEIEVGAQAILDARTNSMSLADLYDPEKMPGTLRKAHAANDRLVMKAYGFDPSWSEDQIFTGLYRLYQQLIAAEVASKTK